MGKSMFGCLTCGKTVIDYTSNRFLYCSKECYGKARRLGKFQTPKTPYLITKELVERIGKCQICNSTSNLMAHHLNSDRSDNRLKNILIICRKCHFNQFHKDKLEIGLKKSKTRIIGKPRIKTNCFICNKPLETYVRNNKHYFCSQNCYKIFRKGYQKTNLTKRGGNY